MRERYLDKRLDGNEKIELLLQGFDALMDLSVEFENEVLHTKLVNMLNGDELKNVIVRNTVPWRDSEDKGSQVESISLIFRICQKIDAELLEESGILMDSNVFGLLYAVVSERQKFIGRI